LPARRVAKESLCSISLIAGISSGIAIFQYGKEWPQAGCALSRLPRSMPGWHAFAVLLPEILQ
jgi:hypothetical protein